MGVARAEVVDSGKPRGAVLGAQSLRAGTGAGAWPGQLRGRHSRCISPAPMEPSDDVLFERYAMGDTAAFQLLLSRYRRRVLDAVKRVGTRALRQLRITQREPDL